MSLGLSVLLAGQNLELVYEREAQYGASTQVESYICIGISPGHMIIPALARFCSPCH